MITGIRCAKALAGLRIDGDGIYEADMAATLGSVPAGIQSLLECGRTFFFKRDLVRQPLMMKTRRINGRLRAHAEPHPVNDT